MRYVFVGFSVIVLLFLSGCSFESDPVLPPKSEKEMTLDRLSSTTPPTTPTPSQPTPPSQSPTPPTTPMNKRYTGAPAMQIDTTKSYTTTLHTDKGDIVIALNAKATPITVNNFVFLAKDHFYDGTIFHRTIKGFMIQGGDPEGTRMGGPGYQFNDEPITESYTRGTVAMANAGANTNGSQFFIMHADYALPKNYVIFGHVTTGLDVVDAIATAPTQPGGEGSKPVTPVILKSVDVMETSSGTGAGGA